MSETQQDIAKSRVQAFNPGADICSGEEFLRRAGRWLEDANDIDDASLSPVESNEQSAFPHTEHIETFVLRHSLPIKRRLFNEWISLRLRFAEGQILRVKGIVHLCDADRPLFIHGVQQMFHPAKPLDNWPTNERETRLVFISKGVSQEIIERSFEKYVLRNGGSLSNPESQHTRPAASISR
ncbi:MAG: GTP-binding protein [Pseudomonadota bacterium]